MKKIAENNKTGFKNREINTVNFGKIIKPL